MFTAITQASFFVPKEAAWGVMPSEDYRAKKMKFRRDWYLKKRSAIF